MTNLLETTVRLVREVEGDSRYYKLIIGTDPVTQIIIADNEIQALLYDLPKIFSSIIYSQVLIENHQTKKEN